MIGRRFALWALHERVVLLAFGTSLLLFGVWPELDLRATAPWYRAGAGFVGAGMGWVQVLYVATPWVGKIVVLALLALLLACALRPRWCSATLRRRARIALACWILGVGLLVNTGLKDHWGRPRPAHLVQYGGQSYFQPALAPSSQCGTNCSFVSGHAATGFMLMSFGLLAGPRARRRWLAIGLVSGAIIGFARMLQGGHFASDIVFAFFAVWWTCQAVLWARGLFVRDSDLRAPPASAEQA